MKARRLAAVALIAAVALTGCSQLPVDSTDTQSEPATAATQDARTLIDELEATKLADRRDDLIASVRPNELLLTDADGKETSLPMPADEFYLSFAPYVDQTHDCYFHSLTTCVGELRNQPIEVTITDSETGETLIAETLTTNDNGFIGVWLPRNISATLEVRGDGLTASAEISTAGEDTLTCLTTLQLS